MGLGSLAAATGLSKSIDYVSQNQREFAQMDNLEKDIAKDQQASMMAQELEAKQYEEIANKASEMLEPDRVKIKKKSLELQKTIRSKIEEHGSRKAFFENGGIALLSKYKSDVLTSPETLGYMDNKKNMETLMKIMADGKGHLISDLDKQSLDNYNAGIGDGKITYSGMKSEVTIPEKYYDYQKEVPPEIILKSNYLQIYNNWLLDNPTLTGLTGEALKEQLLDYTFKNHYGQGTNMQKYQNDLANENLRRQQKATEEAGTGKGEANETYFTSEMNNAFNAGRESLPMTLDNVMGGDNYTLRMAQSNPEIGALAGDLIPYNDVTSNYTYAEGILGGDSMFDKFGKKILKSINYDNKWKVSSATVVPVKSAQEVINFLYPGSKNSNAVNVTLNQSEFYSPNGQLLKKDFVESQDGSPMKYEGLIYAFVDGQNKLVTEVLDSDGKPLSKKDASGKRTYTDAETGQRATYSGNLKNDMFAVLVTANGEKIYQRMNADSLIGESKLNKAIGVTNNITKFKKDRQEKAYQKNVKQIETKWNAKVLQNDVAIASAPGGIFSTPEFKADASATKVADGSNRTTATKAYYMALSYLTESNDRAKGTFNPDLMLSDGYYKKNNENNFTNRVNYSPELKDALINKNKINDVDFIKLMGKIHAGTNEEDIAANEEMTSVWIKFYELLNKK